MKKKNMIIAGVIVWNLGLMAVLIVVWATWREKPQLGLGATSATAGPQAGGVSGEQNFTYETRDRLVGDKAPPISGRDLTITATFDTEGKDGVIVAHGGLAHGYALYVQEGQLFFALRRNNTLTTVDGGKLTAGRRIAKATLSKSGELGLSLDGNIPAIAQAAGGITAEPVDGLDIGADRGAPVGLYTVPNDFGGTLESVSLKTVP